MNARSALQTKDFVRVRVYVCVIIVLIHAGLQAISVETTFTSDDVDGTRHVQILLLLLTQEVQPSHSRSRHLCHTSGRGVYRYDDETEARRRFALVVEVVLVSHDDGSGLGGLTKTPDDVVDDAVDDVDLDEDERC